MTIRNEGIIEEFYQPEEPEQPEHSLEISVQVIDTDAIRVNFSKDIGDLDFYNDRFGYGLELELKSEGKRYLLSVFAPRGQPHLYILDEGRRYVDVAFAGSGQGFGEVWLHTKHWDEVDDDPELSDEELLNIISQAEYELTWDLSREASVEYTGTYVSPKQAVLYATCRDSSGNSMPLENLEPEHIQIFLDSRQSPYEKG